VKAAARATAFAQDFFACGKTVLRSLPALDGFASVAARQKKRNSQDIRLKDRASAFANGQSE